MSNPIRISASGRNNSVFKLTGRNRGIFGPVSTGGSSDSGRLSPSTAVTPNYEENFSTFTNSAQLQSTNRFNQVESRFTTPAGGGITLGTDGGSMVGLNNYTRITYATSAANTDYQMNIAVGGPNGSSIQGSTPQNIWLEWHIRYGTNFQTLAQGGGRRCFCKSVSLNGNSGRYNLEWIGSLNGQDLVAVDGATGGFFIGQPPMPAINFSDGQWHRYRLAIAFSANGSPRLRWWIDDTKVVDRTDFATSGIGGLLYFTSCLNINDGFSASGATQDWGYGAYWLGTNDPGWV